jgi:hypothetical protein
MNVIVVELLTVEALLPLLMAVSAIIDGRANLKAHKNTADGRLNGVVIATRKTDGRATFVR